MKRARHWLPLALLVVALIACTPVRAAPVAQAAPPAEAAPAAQDLPAAQPQETSPALAQEPARTITVVGVGKVSLVPDIARINVGAEARADTVSEAKDEVDEQIAAITAALGELGIEAKDIQTNHYSIHYEREPAPAKPEGAGALSQDGYRVSNMLQVTVREVERAGAVLDAVVEAGANQVYGVTFTVSDEAEWQGLARQKAMEDAAERARELANLADIELGAVLSVSEVIQGLWSGPINLGWTSGIGGGGGGFAPGELEMSTNVQVTFAAKGP